MSSRVEFVEETEQHPDKDAGLAAVLSLIVPGGGYAYLEKWRRFAVFILLFIVTAITLIGPLVLTLFAVWDTYRIAKK